jgi:hypothetical protein
MDEILDEPAVISEKPSSPAVKSSYADDTQPTSQVEPKMETVTFKKKKQTFITDEPKDKSEDNA